MSEIWGERVRGKESQGRFWHALYITSGRHIDPGINDTPKTSRFFCHVSALPARKSDTAGSPPAMAARRDARPEIGQTAGTVCRVIYGVSWCHQSIAVYPSYAGRSSVGKISQLSD